MKITKKMLNKNLFISDGNKKLVDNGSEYFLIWSLPAVITCPQSTKLCRKSCYALKSEIQYPNVRDARERNFAQSRAETFVDDINQYIEWHVNRPSKKGKKVYFRIHESGDFYCNAYFLKWCDIATDNPDITFTAYTKSIRVVSAMQEYIPNNLIIRYSVWDDTKDRDRTRAEDMQLPIYTAMTSDKLDKAVADDGYTYCHCDCSKCKKCYEPDVKKIVVAIH